MFKLDFKKAEEPEIKLPTSIGSQKNQENCRVTSASLTTPKPLTVWITANCGTFLNRWNILKQAGRPPYLPPEKLYAVQEATVRTIHGTTDWFQNGKGVYQGCHPAYLTYMQSTSCESRLNEAQLEKRMLGEISITSDMQMTPPLWQKVKRN